MAEREKALLTVEEVAQRLGVKRDHVYTWVRTGWLPAVEVPDVRGWRVRVSDLNAWMRGLPPVVARQQEKS